MQDRDFGAKLSINSIVSINNNIATNKNIQNSKQNEGIFSVGKTPKGTSQDTIEISSKKGKKKTLKILAIIGVIGVATIGCLKLYNAKKTQKLVKDIFLEDFSMKEASSIKKKYRSLMKIEDKDEFVEKFTKELKKDYKIDDLNIKLDKSFKRGTEIGALKGAAEHSSHFEKGYETVGVDLANSTKEELSNFLTHELRHAKQNKLVYQVGSPEELKTINKIKVQNCAKNEIKDGEKIKDLSKDIEELSSEWTCWQENYYKKLGIKKLSKEDKNFDWGRKILESNKIDALGSDTIYNACFYETDAKKAGFNMLKLLGYKIKE